MDTVYPHIRFREVRERLGLTHDRVAELAGVSKAEIWDFEAHENELAGCYSPSQIQKFGQILQLHPTELFGERISEPTISADELERRIRVECRSRGISIEQFDDIVGWRLSEIMQPPTRLLEGMTLDGLQWLCRELHIDWRRVL